jgi:hypothetical protein
MRASLWRRLRVKRWLFLMTMAGYFALGIFIQHNQSAMPSYLSKMLVVATVGAMLATLALIKRNSTCPNCGRPFGDRGLTWRHGPLVGSCRWCGIRFGAPISKDSPASLPSAGAYRTIDDQSEARKSS